MRCPGVSSLFTRCLSRRRLETCVSALESCPIIQQYLRDCLQTWSRLSDETGTCSSNGSTVCLPVEQLLNLFFNQCHPLIAYPRIYWRTIEYRFNYHSILSHMKYLLLTCKFLGNVGALCASMQQSTFKSYC